MTDTQNAPQGTPPITRSLFFIGLLYGGMTVIAGVLGFKQVALGPLAVDVNDKAKLTTEVESIVISTKSQICVSKRARAILISAAAD